MGSVSYQWDDSRPRSDSVLYYRTGERLCDKCGYLSDRNRIFLLCVYYHAITDTLRVLEGCDESVSGKIGVAYQIFANEITQIMMKEKLDGVGVAADDKASLVAWCISWLAPGMVESRDIKILYKLCALLNPDFPAVIEEENIIWLRNGASQLVASVAAGIYDKAISVAEKLIASKRFKGKRQMRLIVMMQVLSALQDDRKNYFSASKLLIEQYLKNGEYTSAKTELDDWLSIFPADEDLLRMERWMRQFG